MAICLLGLGSNLGRREENVAAALAALERTRGIRVLKRSSLYRSAPVGGPPAQGEFLNAAALIETELSPHDLLAELHRVEAERGRMRDQRWSARSIDLDLLLYDEQQVTSETLIVPHPRMAFRRFVLAPVAEIAADMRHPQIGWTLGELLMFIDRSPDCIALVGPGEKCREIALRVEKSTGWKRITGDSAADAPAALLVIVGGDGAAGESVSPPAGRPFLYCNGTIEQIVDEVTAAIDAMRGPVERCDQ